MTIQQFIEKWGFVGGAKPVFDMRDQLRKDLDEMLADTSTEAYSPEGKTTNVYIPEKEDETVVYKNRGWFTVIDHT